jgi:hypothetical protein
MFTTVMMIALSSVGGHNCASSCAVTVSCATSCHVSSCAAVSSCCCRRGLFQRLFGRKCNSCASSCHVSACNGCHVSHCAKACAGACNGEKKAAEPEKKEAPAPTKPAPPAGEPKASTSLRAPGAIRTVSYKTDEVTYVSKPVVIFYRD